MIDNKCIPGFLLLNDGLLKLIFRLSTANAGQLMVDSIGDDHRLHFSHHLDNKHLHRDPVQLRMNDDIIKYVLFNRKMIPSC